MGRVGGVRVGSPIKGRCDKGVRRTRFMMPEDVVVTSEDLIFTIECQKPMMELVQGVIYRSFRSMVCALLC